MPERSIFEDIERMLQEGPPKGVPKGARLVGVKVTPAGKPGQKPPEIDFDEMLSIDPVTFKPKDLAASAPISPRTKFETLRLGASSFFNIARHHRSLRDLSIDVADETRERLSGPAMVATDVLMTPFRLYSKGMTFAERQLIGRVARAGMPKRIKQVLPQAPAVSEIVQAISPDIRQVLREIGIKSGNEFTVAELPDGTVDIKLRANPPWHKIVEFGLEMGLSASNPADVLSILAVGRGARMLTGTPAGKRFVANLGKALPESLQRQMYWGEFRVPEEIELLIDDRNIRIQRALAVGQKIDDKLLSLSPAERMRIHQIRAGGISVRPEEAKIRTYAQAYGRFIDYLTKRLVETGATSPEAAKVLQQNIGQYAPRLYRIFEKPLETGKIPSDVLARIWSMEPAQITALAELNPKLAEHFATLIEKVSKRPSFDASGFKPTKIRVSDMLKARMERKLVAKELGALRAESQKFYAAGQKVGLENVPGLGGVAQARLKQKGMDLETLAGMIPQEVADVMADLGKADLGVFLAGFSEANAVLSATGRKPTVENMKWLMGLSDSAKEVLHQKRSFLGRADQYKGHVKFLPLKKLAETAEFRYALGEIRDPAVLLAKRAARTISSAETAELYNRLAAMPQYVMPVGEKPGLVSVLSQKYVQMPDDPGWGRLAGRWVDKAVANRVQEMRLLTDRVPGALIKAMRAWKFGKVVLNPSTHFRNLTSNAILLDFSGVPAQEIPGLLVDAATELINKGGIYKRAFKSGAITNDYLSAELNVIKNRLLEPTESGHAFESIANVVRDGFSAAGTAYQSEEQLFKLAKFMYETRKGRSALQAAREAQEWLFNYGKVPPLIRKLREHPLGVPFITFPYKALPKVFDTLKADPLKVAKYEVFFRSLDRASTAQRGLTPEQALNEKRVTGREDALYTRNVRLPFTDSGDNPYFLDLTYTLPWGDLTEMDYVFGTPRAFTAGGLSRPVLDILYNTAWGDKKIFKPGDSTLEIAQKAATHLYKFYAPNLLGFGAVRLSKSVRGMTEVQTGVPQPVPMAVADVVFGLKARGVDVQARHEMKLRFLERAKSEQEDEIERAGRNREKGVISEDEFARVLQQKLQNIQRIDTWLEQLERMDFGK